LKLIKIKIWSQKTYVQFWTVLTKKPRFSVFLALVIIALIMIIFWIYKHLRVWSKETQWEGTHESGM